MSTNLELKKLGRRSILKLNWPWERKMGGQGIRKSKDVGHQGNHELEQKKERALAALMEVTRLLARQLPIDELLWLIVDKTSEVMNAERSTIYLVDRETGELWSKVAQRSEIHEIRLAPGQGLAGHAYATGQVICVNDAYNDPRFDQRVDALTGWQTRNMLVIPMRDPESQIIGVFQVMNKKTGGFEAADEDLLSAFSSAAAVSIEGARLRQQATTDYLTGLLNRHGLEDMFERELARARRYQRDLTVIMVDIDRFKEINDTHGHRLGDEVLKAVASAIKASFRGSDITARYGGDEFVVVLPETSVVGAKRAVERLRGKVGEFNATKSLSVDIVLSIGIATVEDDYDHLMERADAAMYEEKRQHHLDRPA